MIFRKELELLGYRMPGLSLDFLIEERAHEKSFGHRGRIDPVRLPLIVPDFAGREVFCCGPEPFMRRVHDMLAAAGLDMAHYHQESFAAPPAEPVPAVEDVAREASEGRTVAVRFALSEVEGECLPGQTVLQAARASGVRIPAACEFGLCGTCKVRMHSGKVDMEHNGGILDHEIEDGFLLACCSHPRVAIEIEA